MPQISSLILRQAQDGGRWRKGNHPGAFPLPRQVGEHANTYGRLYFRITSQISGFIEL